MSKKLAVAYVEAPAQHLCEETQRARHNTTWCRDWELEPCDTTQKILSTLQRRFGYTDGRTGLFQQQLETRAWLCVLTEAQTLACWSKGSVSQWYQPAFVKEYKFPSLPNTYCFLDTIQSQLRPLIAIPSDILSAGFANNAGYSSTGAADGQPVFRTRTIQQPAELYQREQARDTCV